AGAIRDLGSEHVLKGKARPAKNRSARQEPKEDTGVRHPDIRSHFLPLAVSYDGHLLAAEHCFQAHVGPMRLNRALAAECLPSHLALSAPFRRPRIPDILG